MTDFLRGGVFQMLVALLAADDPFAGVGQQTELALEGISIRIAKELEELRRGEPARPATEQILQPTHVAAVGWIGKKGELRGHAVLLAKNSAASVIRCSPTLNPTRTSPE